MHIIIMHENAWSCKNFKIDILNYFCDGGFPTTLGLLGLNPQLICIFVLSLAHNGDPKRSLAKEWWFGTGVWWLLEIWLFENNIKQLRCHSGCLKLDHLFQSPFSSFSLFSRVSLSNEVPIPSLWSPLSFLYHPPSGPIIMM